MRALRIVSVLFLSTITAAFSSHLKWSGARLPAKASAGDGVIKLSSKIGTFFTPTNADEAVQIVFNVNRRFSGSHPWATLAAGKVPGAIPIAPEVTEQILSRMDDLGVDIFLEIYPHKTDDVPA